MHIPVAIGIITNEHNEILFIKRERGNFRGQWALPGGKLEDGEGIFEAVIREIYEETGLKVKVEKFLGVAAEIVHRADSTESTLLFLCKLNVVDGTILKSSSLGWLDMTSQNSVNAVVYSDRLFLDKFYFNENCMYLKLDCYLQPDGSYYWKE